MSGLQEKLYSLIESGNEGACLALLEEEKGEDPWYSKMGESLWHVAIRKNLINILDFLLKNSKCMNVADTSGLTPWGLAVFLGKNVLAQRLKEHGADVSVAINSSGHTLLHHAVLSCNDKLLEYCYQSGLLLDVPDQEGKTPLYYAAQLKEKKYFENLRQFHDFNSAAVTDLENCIIRDDVNGLKKLLERGIDIDHKNGWGHTVLDTAILQEKENIAKILVKFGGHSTLPITGTPSLTVKNNEKASIIDSCYRIVVEYDQAPILVLTEKDERGEDKTHKIAPWSSEQAISVADQWKVVLQNENCYVLLARIDNPNQPRLICQLAKTGELKLRYANLPNSDITISTYNDFKIDSLSFVNKLQVNARNISTAKECRYNGSALYLSASTIKLDGSLACTEIKTNAPQGLQQLGEIITEKFCHIGGSVTANGQLFISKSCNVESDNSVDINGQIVCGHDGTIKGHRVEVQRNAVLVSQQGELNLHGKAAVVNSGALIANQIYLDSSILIKNNVGALIKSLSCILHAPQTIQAGFLLSGQKSSLSYIDWTLNFVHAGINIAELASYLPAPDAVVLRGYLLVAKTLYRGGELLVKVAEGEPISGSEVVSLVLDNVVPMLGSLTANEEKARLLVNILYHFYGAYSSEEEFIQKSLEFIEILAKALSVYSMGMLSPEQTQWLQDAARIIKYSRVALKATNLSAGALQAWYEGDKNELEKVQMDMEAMGEALFQEALYRLDPIKLLHIELPIREMVQFILNQGHTSDYFLQSVLFGTLHAAQKSGLIENTSIENLEFKARLLLRSKHWLGLCQDFQNKRLSAKAVLNEALNSLIFYSYTTGHSRQNEVKSSDAAVPDVTTDTVAIEAKEKIDLAEESIPTEDIQPITKLTSEEITAEIAAANAILTQEIPAKPKHVLTIDIEEQAAKALTTQLPVEPVRDPQEIQIKGLIELQKALNGELAAQGYLGAFVAVLHNEGIIDVVGDMSLYASQGTTNNSLMKVSGSLVLSALADIEGYFINFEAGEINAQEAIYASCLTLIKNFGTIITNDQIKITASQIIENHRTGKIIAKKDVALLSKLLVSNEGFIKGQNIVLEGENDKVVNSGVIIAKTLTLLSDRMTEHAEEGSIIAQQVSFKSSHISKKGSIQAGFVNTGGAQASSANQIEWHKHKEDAIGALKLNATEYNLDKDAFEHTELVDVILKHQPLWQTDKPIFEVSPDFSHILQLHFNQSDVTIPIWQLPKMRPEATLILDAPGSRLSSAKGIYSYDSALHFIGYEYDYSFGQTAFNQPTYFDVQKMVGLGGKTSLTLKEGGLIQAAIFNNQGHLHSDKLIQWNVDSFLNEAQLETFKQKFIHSKYTQSLDHHQATRVVEHSGTIEALGHIGFIDEFNQVGGKFLFGEEGSFVYFKNNTQKAILTQQGVKLFDYLEDEGKNWYVLPQWHNAQIGGVGQNILVGSGKLVASGADIWGDKALFVQASQEVAEKQSASYQSEATYSVSHHHGKKKKTPTHNAESSQMVAKNNISSNHGEVTMVASEGSIQLQNIVLSSAKDTTLAAKDKVSINGITVAHQEESTATSKSLLKKKKTHSKTEEERVYCSFIFTGGKLVVRADEFELNAVQGVIGGTDIVAHKTIFSGQEQTLHNKTVTKEFSIGFTGVNSLTSIMKSHNAKAVFASVMNASGWNQKELEALLNANSITELPKPLLNTARNAWNLSALVAHACQEYGGKPADFVGTFTDQMGITFTDNNGKRSFNPKFDISTSKTVEETHSSKTIATSLYVGGTFRLVGDELLLLNGSAVDAEHLRVFLNEGIKATQGTSTYSYEKRMATATVGINPLQPKDVSVGVSKESYKESYTQHNPAMLQARSSAEIIADKEITGELQIKAPAGIVSAPTMKFNTSQNRYSLRSSSKSMQASTAGTGAASCSSLKVDEATTGTKAGIFLASGTVAANNIHLENGSKIAATSLLRQDGKAGLPSVTGTEAQDFRKEKRRGFSVSMSAQREPSAEIELGDKQSETIHRPTILADNVKDKDLPGINTLASRETEVVNEKERSIALAGFIPNKKKMHADAAAIKDVAKDGLHFLFGKKDNFAASVKESQLADVSVLEGDPLPNQETTDDVMPLKQGRRKRKSSQKKKTPKEKPSQKGKKASQIDELPPSSEIFMEPEEVPIINSEQHPSQPAARKGFRLPSAMPGRDPNPVLDYIFAIGRGIEKGRDNVVDAILHPWETVSGIGQTVWDGWNAIGDKTVGLSTQGARERNAKRGQVTVDAIEQFSEVDGVHKAEMLAEAGAEAILGAAIGGAPRRLLGKVVGVKTPEGYAFQNYTTAARKARKEVKNGAPLYRAGPKKKGISQQDQPNALAGGQYHAINPTPSNPHYAAKYGIPEKNAAGIELAVQETLKPGTKFVTRPAPGVGRNGGGAIEVVTPRNSTIVTDANVPFVPQIPGNRPRLLQFADKAIQTAASEPVLGMASAGAAAINDKVKKNRPTK